jgi:hypothetical protein
MKKLLIALLALSVAGTAFAADPALTFSGALKTGIEFSSNDATSADEDGTVSLYNDDAGKFTRLDLNGAYTDGDFGMKFQLRTNDLTAPSYNYAYAWGNLFNNMVTFKVGDVDDGAWATEGDEGFDVADGNGLQIQVKPMAGLNLGAKLQVAGYTYEATQQELALGLGYTSDMFNFQAGYQMDSDADATFDLTDKAIEFSGLDADDNGKLEGAELVALLTLLDIELEPEDNASAYVGFSYKGMKALKAVAEAKLFNLGSDLGYTWANQVIEYAVNDQISAGIVMHQYLWSNADIADGANLYSFKPYGNYKLNEKVTLGLAVYYSTWMMNVSGVDAASELYLQPSATVQLGPKAKFVGFYKYDTVTMDKDFFGDPVNTQTIQLDFIYSF